MKVPMIKQPGGMLIPADDYTVEKLKKFLNFEQYEVEIRLVRNPKFHRKVFLFFGFCFEHWVGGHEFQDESTQFDAFRKQLTILAGFRKEIVNLRTHTVGYEAESLSFGSMSQERFEECYSALINAAMEHVFKSADDNTYNRLLSFF